jgi:hypothetical protein
MKLLMLTLALHIATIGLWRVKSRSDGKTEWRTPPPPSCGLCLNPKQSLTYWDRVWSWPSTLVEIYKRFAETCCSYLQSTSEMSITFYWTTWSLMSEGLHLHPTRIYNITSLTAHLVPVLQGPFAPGHLNTHEKSAQETISVQSVPATDRSNSTPITNKS